MDRKNDGYKKKEKVFVTDMWGTKHSFDLMSQDVELDNDDRLIVYVVEINNTENYCTVKVGSFSILVEIDQLHEVKNLKTFGFSLSLRTISDGLKTLGVGYHFVMHSDYSGNINNSMGEVLFSFDNESEIMRGFRLLAKSSDEQKQKLKSNLLTVLKDCKLTYMEINEVFGEALADAK